MLSMCVSSVLAVFKTKRLSLIVNIVFVLKYYTSRLVRSLSRCHFFLSWRLKTQDKFFFSKFQKHDFILSEEKKLFAIINWYFGQKTIWFDKIFNTKRAWGKYENLFKNWSFVFEACNWRYIRRRNICLFDHNYLYCMTLSSCLWRKSEPSNQRRYFVFPNL